jgi:hypothetical protein
MAQIDSSIPLGVRPAQVESPMNALARVLQVQGLQQEQALHRMKVDDYQQGVQRKNRMYSLLDQEYAKPEDREGALLRGGFVDESAKLAKDRRENMKIEADTGKTKAETKKIDFDGEIKRIEHVSSVLSTAKDPASYQVAIQTLAQTFGPEIVAKLPQQFDPAVLQATVAQGMTLTQRLNDERQRQQIAETGRHNQATERTSAGQLAVSQGNLGLRRQELEHSRSQPRGQFIETTNGYVLADPKSGDVRPVTGPDGKPLRGKAADRSLNETQAKANLFGTRMREADRILGTLDGKYSPAAVDAKMGADNVPLIGGLTGAIGNAMLSSEGQQAEQAQRDFINAVLRRESGAAIAASEFANARKQYFPEPNDSAEKKSQKARNRQLAIQGLEAEVPGGFRGAPSLTGTGQQGGASGEWSGGAGKVVDFGSLK